MMASSHATMRSLPKMMLWPFDDAWPLTLEITGFWIRANTSVMRAAPCPMRLGRWLAGRLSLPDLVVAAARAALEQAKTLNKPLLIDFSAAPA